MANQSEKIPQIVAEWRTGNYTQRDLASKHRVSVGFINKHTKGIVRDTAVTVNKLVEAKQELAYLDEQSVNAVHAVVDERTRHIQLFNTLAANNAIKASRLPCETHQDHERLSNTILRSKEVVLGKAPDTAIQINNTQSPTTMSDERFSELARKALAET